MLKINITFFIKNYSVNIFILNNVFLEKAVFSEETVKNWSGTYLTIFVGKGGFLSGKLI